jgi:hypothetical protein
MIVYTKFIEENALNISTLLCTQETGLIDGAMEILFTARIFQ